ncbi:ATP-dependent zinc protease [Zophobihabitans entericus]|uniref:ATP-dependent zinc protease n=2 Tax=Zophobihabitans entericus TaxID=1635327 RepID=A0A6G9IDV4_9GAMM|nr:ATP-dependent zinc protease [Zophobihabitans entericus]
MLVFMSSSFAAQKPIYGIYEKVKLVEFDNVVVRAKFDTGALTTSLGATNIHIFDKDGVDWVRFTPQIEGVTLPEMESPLVRHSNIKRRSGDTSDDVLHTVRPVIMLDICFDGKIYSVEANLTDRSRFNYPLLVGKTALQEFNILIDPKLKYQSKPDCK